MPHKNYHCYKNSIGVLPVSLIWQAMQNAILPKTKHVMLCLMNGMSMSMCMHACTYVCVYLCVCIMYNIIFLYENMYYVTQCTAYMYALYYTWMYVCLV